MVKNLLLAILVVSIFTSSSYGMNEEYKTEKKPETLCYLTDLPAELVIKIMEYCDEKTLARLACCCSLLNNACNFIQPDSHHLKTQIFLYRKEKGCDLENYLAHFLCDNCHEQFVKMKPIKSREEDLCERCRMEFCQLAFLIKTIKTGNAEAITNSPLPFSPFCWTNDYILWLLAKKLVAHEDNSPENKTAHELLATIQNKIIQMNYDVFPPRIEMFNDFLPYTIGKTIKVNKNNSFFRKMIIENSYLIKDVEEADEKRKALGLDPIASQIEAILWFELWTKEKSNQKLLTQ